jgi:hypothetical protein
VVQHWKPTHGHVKWLLEHRLILPGRFNFEEWAEHGELLALAAPSTPETVWPPAP